MTTLVSPYSRTRNRQLVRVLKLIAILNNGWYELDSLATELRVSTRTIRRDLAAVEEAHLPLWTRNSLEDRKTRWRMGKSATQVS